MRCALRLVRRRSLDQASCATLNGRTLTSRWLLNRAIQSQRPGSRHIVRPSRQALEDPSRAAPIHWIRALRLPRSAHQKRPMSDNAALAAMRRMGIGKEEQERARFSGRSANDPG